VAFAWRSFVAWFVGQSLVFIAVAFALGLLVGWLWWGRRRLATAAPAEGPTAVIAEGPTAVLPESAPAPAEDRMVDIAAAAVPTAPVTSASVIAAEEPTAVIPRQSTVEPEPTPEPVPDEDAAGDDLERIEGIGPKMAGALRAAGISTYAALARSDDAALRAAIEGAGLSFAPSLVTWARQARLLADGDEDGFADLTRRLVAGRDTGRQ
jgi:predicted flap endonuclease-1-like 5' DNA nuclease